MKMKFLSACTLIFAAGLALAPAAYADGWHHDGGGRDHGGYHDGDRHDHDRRDWHPGWDRGYYAPPVITFGFQP